MTSRIRSWFRKKERSPETHDAETEHVALPAPGFTRQPKAMNLPRFGGMANDADTVESVNSARSYSRKLLGRAFPLSQPVTDLRQFAGRRPMLASVIRSIEEQRMHVVLYGDRGIGKTSLLHILSILAQEARYQVRYTSCSQSSDFNSTFRAIAQDIPLLYHNKADPTSEQVEAGKSLADLIDDRPLTPDHFSEILEGVSGTRLLIILDEFDRADSLEFRRSVAELIKNLSDRSSRVQILIGGVAANLKELIQHIPSIRRNLLGIPVQRMSNPEIDEILKNGEWICSLHFKPDARRKLAEGANGSPYLANLIAYHAGSFAMDRHSNDVLVDDVMASIAQIAADLVLRMDERACAQMAALREELPVSRLRDLARHSIDHFGRISPDDAGELSRLAKTDPSRSDWINVSGQFQFLDDSIPLAIWLNSIFATSASVTDAARSSDDSVEVPAGS